RMPGGSNSPETFWRLLRDGVDARQEVPAERWDIAAYYDPDPDAPGKMYSRWGAFIEDADKFDAGFFGLAPREAISMDPQQCVLLETAWQALENAGQAGGGLRRSRTGVFVGIGQQDYSNIIARVDDPTSLDAHYVTGNLLSAVAGRVSYALGL